MEWQSKPPKSGRKSKLDHKSSENRKLPIANNIALFSITVVKLEIYCWCPKGIRLATLFQIVRQCEYGYSAISPNEGIIESLCMPYSNTDCMQIFIDYVSEHHSDRQILMFLDQASFHTSEKLVVPDNMVFFPILAHSPELNPVEVLWLYIRTHYFKNDWFENIKDVSDRLF